MTTDEACVVFRPSFLEGFWMTVDYWDIQIEDAIAAVSAQDIVDNCYDAPTLNNPFCELFTRNRNASSPTYLGFDYLLQSQTNFAGLEASGIDFAMNYDWDLGRAGVLGFNVSGTYLEDRNDFPFPSDPNLPDPVKGELNYPEWAGSTRISWTVENLTLSLFSNYSDTQALVGIEDIALFTPAKVDSVWTHDLSVRWKVDDKKSLIFGVNNLFDEEPFLSLVNNPAPAVGRYFFGRFSASF